ncbi:hypothetical protein HYALB_00004913 [Hymenoscyphus albidus]|uniref:Major facilitator superfamily (MFS) profile domain-containing protein n=1 Tax=Hymenoscyphus albidus TaxID=595503 RepID=A0A9N9LB96_9HELO|nr:hypothetical protein HYALB_00004913 [Hymenoscyphus albidus]
MDAQPATTMDSIAGNKQNIEIRADMAKDISHDGPADIKKGTFLEIDATRDITNAEHELKFWDAVRQYPMAVFWALFFCIAVIMAGFDAQIVTSFYALPSFQTHYGSLFEGEYIITAPWQTALGMGNPIGQIVGALAAGWPLEKWGRRWTLAVCCCWSIVFVFVQFFSTSLGMLCAGEILGGLAYGFYVVIGPVYASEVCPLALRGVLTASTNLAFVIGQFIAQGVAAGMANRTDVWAYKIPFLLQVLLKSNHEQMKYLYALFRILTPISSGCGPLSSSLVYRLPQKVLIGLSDKTGKKKQKLP